jgi:hypothetical protein
MEPKVVVEERGLGDGRWIEGSSGIRAARRFA